MKWNQQANLMKIYLKDLESINNLNILIVYRKCLKLLRTYSSVSRDNLKKGLMEDYRENSKLTNPDEIKNAIIYAKDGLKHFYTHEIQRRELHGIPVFYDENQEKKVILSNKKIKPKISVQISNRFEEF